MALRTTSFNDKSVQDATAQLVMGSQRSAHITLTLHSLHWLTVRQQVTFKLATLVHKCQRPDPNVPG